MKNTCLILNTFFKKTNNWKRNCVHVISYVDSCQWKCWVGLKKKIKAILISLWRQLASPHVASGKGLSTSISQVYSLIRIILVQCAGEKLLSRAQGSDIMIRCKQLLKALRRLQAAPIWEMREAFLWGCSTPWQKTSEFPDHSVLNFHQFPCRHIQKESG